jgi:hypothetical protein
MLLFLSPLIDITIAPAAGDEPKLTDYWSVGIAATALLVAGFAAWANFQTNRNQAAQLARLEEDSRSQAEENRRRQATQIWSYLSDNHDIVIRNMSGLPIYDAQCRVGNDLTGFVMKIERYLDPNLSSYIVPQSRELVFKYAKEMSENQKAALGGAHQAAQSVQEVLKSWRIIGTSIAFRDSSSNRWKRTSDGTIASIGSLAHAFKKLPVNRDAF